VSNRIENRTDLRNGTLKHHHSWLSDFINYGKIVSFSDINSTAIREYDDYLHKKGIKQTTIYNYHKHLKSYIIDAIEYENIQYNPYNSVKIERGKAQEIRYLTYDDVQRIMHFDIEDPCLRRVRDIFIFQCHTGLAYADLASFRIENCTEKNGRLLYIGNRVKTEGRFTVMILPPAQDILKRYNNVLPVISNQKYNLYLKSIGNMLGIKTVVTSHVARHTFAVMAINHGVPIEIIAKMMGHTKIETTQIYAKVLNESIENAFLELEKKL
jgi:site-specific recombinase XerD